MTADEIVRRLARINWIEDEGGPWCFFCRRGVTYGPTDSTDRCDHADDCEFALALAYVEANPEPISPDWGFLPGWCCPKDYCCVQFVGDKPCPEGW